MRLVRARFKNLAGVLVPSGKHEIVIDFTRCKGNIILITGPNGNGKSTILNSLDPLPNPQTDFVNGLEGEKEIIYSDNDILYKINIVYPVKYDFSRATTKGYITKIYPDGNEEELNTNGNITSYKDKISELFGLDPNFASLNKLSMEDGGIVSKTPSERKRYVSDILDSVETYNQIYKTLCKRSSVFKSMINSISAKMNNIGDEEALNNRLTSINNRINNLSNYKEELIKKISDMEAIVKVLDPDGSIQNKYNSLIIELDGYNDELKQLKVFITNCPYDNIDDLNNYIKQLDEEILNLDKEIDRLKITNENIVSNLNKAYSDLVTKQSKLDSLSTDDNINQAKNKLKELLEENKELESVIPDSFDKTITLNEFKAALTLIENINQDISRLKEQSYIGSLEDAVKYIKDNGDINLDIKNLKLDIIKLENSIRDLKLQELTCNNDLELSKVLNDRPSTCNDDNCPFIKNALEAANKKPEERIKEISDSIYHCQLDLTIDSDYLQELEETSRLYNLIMVILRNIDANKDILNRVNATFITNRDSILDNIVSSNNFNKEMDKLQNDLSIVNALEIYKNNLKEIERLQFILDAYKDKVSLIEELTDSVLLLKEDVDEGEKRLNENNANLDRLSKEAANKMSQRNTMQSYYINFDKVNTLESKINETKSRLNTISESIESIKKTIDQINQTNSIKVSTIADLNPLEEEKNRLLYSINLLALYKEELNEINLKYEKVEIIKKYSSPNKAGIQTLYMELYMGKTLRMANELLAMMFNGRLTILDYIINDNEFRIPCKSSTSEIINDDIRSCSSAERFMASMFISFALSMQSSVKYNIIRLDEIDGPLDEDNRRAFIPVMSKIIEMMNVDQCILISHNSESELSNVDIIDLRTDGHYVGPGNVIFTYY